MAISVVFTKGSRIFADNKRQLNKPPEPIDCKLQLLESGAICDEDTIPSFSNTRYNPKTRKCECYNIKNEKLQSCKEKIESIINVDISPFWVVGDTCCCQCPITDLFLDCFKRGWDYMDANNDDVINLDIENRCKCDCETRINNNYYLSQDDCPNYPLVGSPEGLAGLSVWNPYTCECECEKLPWFKGCDDPFIKGPNCQCICNPDNIPNECDSKMDGSNGIFDAYGSCSCIYPCPPLSIPYYCHSKNPNFLPTLENHVLRCAKCNEGEYLGACISDGLGAPIRRCCPYGTIWKDNFGCVECNEANAPQCERGYSQLNTKTCSCCPDNYLYDDALEECVLACETIYSPDQLMNIPSSECVSPRSITEDCECVCPSGTSWIDNTCIPYENICPLPSDHPDFNPLKTVWDPIEEECVCDIEFDDASDYCDEQIINSYFDSENCECKCGGDSILNESESVCVCPSGTSRRAIDFFNTQPICLSCGDIHGYMPSSDEPLAIWNGYNSCACIEGYIFEKLNAEQFLNRIDPRCIECEEYTEHAALIDGQCSCAPGFIAVSDNESFNTTDFICVPEPSPSPETTPSTSTPMPEFF